MFLIFDILFLPLRLHSAYALLSLSVCCDSHFNISNNKAIWFSFQTCIVFLHQLSHTCPLSSSSTYVIHMVFKIGNLSCFRLQVQELICLCITVKMLVREPTCHHHHHWCDLGLSVVSGLSSQDTLAQVIHCVQGTSHFSQLSKSFVLFLHILLIW